MEGRSVGTIREKCPKQGLTIAEDLTMYVYIYICKTILSLFFIEVLIDEDELPDVCLLEEDE